MQAILDGEEVDYGPFRVEQRKNHEDKPIAVLRVNESVTFGAVFIEQAPKDELSDWMENRVADAQEAGY